MSRRKAREIAFKVVFQVDQVGIDPEKAFDYLMESQGLAGSDQEFAQQLISGCIGNLAAIDEQLSSYSHDWALNRMLSADRNIMRLAAFEILYMDKSQSVIAIDEAIELAKKYGDQNSASFVNAILDRILGNSK